MKEKPRDYTNALPQKVDYDLNDHLIYGKQKTWKKVIEWIITIIAWIILLSYIIYLVYGMLAVKYDWYLPNFVIYNREMIIEIKKYFFILFIAFLIIVAILIIWKNYNLRRFGKLHRRKFRPPVDNSELAEMFKLDKKTIEMMQNERVIILEKNIIPEELGMGGKDKKRANK